MKALVFTLLFTLLFLIPIAYAGTFSIGCQPSTIILSLSPENNRIILPLKLWNEGSENAEFLLTPENLTEFTNFTQTSILIKGNTTRLSNYTTVTIIFTKTSGNKSIEGGIYIRAKPTEETAIVKIIPQIFMRINITQTDVETGQPPYTFPQSTPQPSLVGSNHTPSTNSTPFFLRTPVIIAGILILALIGVLVWWLIFRTSL